VVDDGVPGLAAQVGGVIRRDPAAAEAKRHDLIVVGGGVYGVTLTLEAARRGLRPLLVERDDFGAGTSWHSLRIVHGGLRYLQKLDLTRFVESVSERRWFLQHYPELVRTMPCLMPLYGEGLRRAPMMRAALFANDLLSWSRNRGCREDRHIPRSRVLSKAETLERFPGAVREGLRAGALWHDGVMPDSQRLIVEMLHWATACGAEALNYVEADELSLAGDAVNGVAAVDRESGARHRFRAPVVVNCAGPWCGELAARFDRDDPELFRPSVALNLFLDREPSFRTAVAVTPPVRGARTYFLYPWKGGVFAGTLHAPWDRAPGEPPPGFLVEGLLADLNRALPSLDARLEHVLRLHWGLLPARAPGTDELAVRAVLRNHGRRGGPRGLFSVSGVKFTTARRVAVETLRMVRADQGEALPRYAGLARPPLTAVPDAAGIRRLLEERPAEAREVVARIFRDEAALHLEDLMLRRTDWGLRPAAGRELAESLCLLLGWPEARRSAELATLADRPLTSSAAG
jgi:glycerol-3-phosphate dehydrogenase